MDDEPDVLEQAKIFLEREDDRLEIETASSAEKGLDLLEENNYDAVVSDYRMPQMSGLDFLEALRKERSSDIPFIIFTGRGREEVAIEALNLGADRYLQKGGDPKSQYGVLAQAIDQEVKYKRSEERFERLFYGLGEPAVLTIDGEIIAANRMACEKTGYSREELLGMNMVEDLTAGKEAEKKLSERKEELDKGKRLRFKSTLKAKDGSVLQVQVTSAPIQYKGKRANISINRDITEQEKREEELRKYRMAVEESKDLMAACNEDYRYTFANRAYLEYHDLDRDELAGKKLEDVLGKETFEQEVKPWVDQCLEGESVRYRMEREHPELGERILDISYYPLRSEGDILGAVAVMGDMTERREAEKRFKELFNASPDPTFHLDKNGVFRNINQASIGALGYEREEILGKSISEVPFFPPETKEKLTENLERRLDGEEISPYTIEAETKNGENIIGEVNSSLLQEGGEPVGVIGIARNITERKRVEEELRQYKNAVDPPEGVLNLKFKVGRLYLFSSVYRFVFKCSNKVGECKNVRSQSGYNRLWSDW